MKYSVKRCKNLDLTITMVFVAINIAWTQVANHLVIISTLFALPLIFFLPGYALTQILFRRHQPEQTQASSNSFIRYDPKSLRPIGRADQILLSFGLSIAIDILVGFVLNLFPMGLQGLSWVISLGLVTTAFLLVAVLLRRKDIPAINTKLRVRITLQDFVLSGLAIGIIASTIWLSIIRPLDPQPSFTMLWMLPADQASKTCAVSIGVQSFETTSETYRIVMTVNNTQTNIWSLITLTSQQKWTHSVPISPGKGERLSIEARLYRSDKPRLVYRNAHLTFYIANIYSKKLYKWYCTT